MILTFCAVLVVAVGDDVLQRFFSALVCIITVVIASHQPISIMTKLLKGDRSMRSKKRREKRRSPDTFLI